MSALDWLARVSWQAAVLAVLVLLAQRLLGARLTPRWRCALWWIVIARLVLRMASTQTWPVTRREEKAVLELLDSPEYQEETEYRQRLDAFYKEARKE